MRLTTLETVIVEITKKCPLKCISCYFFEKNKKEAVDMSLKDYKKIINKLPESLTSISISGGEPFVHPEIVEMAKYTAKKSIKPIIFTSGMIPDPAIISQLKPYVDSFNVTIKYPNEMDNLFKGHKDAFKNANDFLQYCAVNDIKTRIHFVVDNKDKETAESLGFGKMGLTARSNYSHFDDMCKLAKKYDSRVILLRFIPFDETQKHRFLPDNLWEGLCEYALTKDNVEIANISQVNKYKCLAGLKRISIDVLGNVSPCVYLNHPVGNIFHEDLNKIRTKLIRWRLDYKRLDKCLAIDFAQKKK